MFELSPATLEQNSESAIVMVLAVARSVCGALGRVIVVEAVIGFALSV